MQFLETPVHGAFILSPTLIPDDRGHFAETFHASQFAERGLDAIVAQVNLSYNDRRHTLRGLHYQVAPHEETKIVRCVRGAVFDVVLDLREESPTFGQWHGVELSVGNRLGLYVPKGCAHGYQTLEDQTEVHYLVSTHHAPAAYRGVRWNDPQFGIVWPNSPERLMHPRDASYPDYPRR
jgi:dTDP-4-dehydrorhamnose 3,5-epimerase